MNSTKRQAIMHRWNVIQHELIPGMREQGDILTPKLEQHIHTLEWVRNERTVAELSAAMPDSRMCSGPET